MKMVTLYVHNVINCQKEIINKKLWYMNQEKLKLIYEMIYAD
jgi:hypothetical protein